MNCYVNLIDATVMKMTIDFGSSFSVDLLPGTLSSSERQFFFALFFIRPSEEEETILICDC